MSKTEFAIQRLDRNGRWYLGREHYSTRKTAQDEIDRQMAMGTYPNGSALDPLRVVSRQVASTWKPVTEPDPATTSSTTTDEAPTEGEQP